MEFKQILESQFVIKLNYMKNFKNVNKKIIRDVSFIKEMINHPFYKNIDNLFSNNNIISIEKENDYFISKENFETLQLLMDYYKEEDFFFTLATGNREIEVFQVSKKVDIVALRNEISEYLYFCLDWYFSSINNNWACVSIYDSNQFFFGIDKGVSTKIITED